MTTRRRKKHRPEEIVTKLRDADAILNAGKDLAAVLQALETWRVDTRPLAVRLSTTSSLWGGVLHRNSWGVTASNWSGDL